MALPAFLFLGFLIWRLRPSMRKLHISRSHIMAVCWRLLLGERSRGDGRADAVPCRCSLPSCGSLAFWESCAA